MDPISGRKRSERRRKAISTVMGVLLTAAAFIAVLQLSTLPAAGQAAAVPGLDAYVGIWRMSFHGKRVGILEFMKYKDQLTGSLTNAHAAIGADGIVSMYQIPGSAPVVETAISEGTLHFVVAEPSEATLGFQMTLKGSDKAYLLFNRKAPNGQTMDFELTKVSWDENEADVAP